MEYWKFLRKQWLLKGLRLRIRLRLRLRLRMHHIRHRRTQIFQWPVINYQWPVINDQLSIINYQWTNLPIDEFLQDKRQSRANQQQATSIQQPATKQVEAKVKVEWLRIHHRYHRFFNEQLPIINYQLSMNQLTNWRIDEFLQDKRQSRANRQQATSNKQPATSNQ
jgi:hypothetical protein